MTVAVIDETAGRLLDAADFDRRELSRRERHCLVELGADLLRRQNYRDDQRLWRPIGRLLQPLEAARASLRWQPPDLRHQRRFAIDAIGLVLMRSGQLGTAFWQWTAEDWTALIGAGAEEFGRPWEGWLDKGTRPYVLAYGYLLAGFTELHSIGRFHRPALAWRVFGREPVDAAVDQVQQVLAGWGYGGTEDRWATATCQLLLINRSPLLADLTDDLFHRVRRDRLLGGRLDGSVHGVHRAVAQLGIVTPPATVGSGPVPISGAAEAWTSMLERWFATSTLTPKTRGITRNVIAKAGRWLAAEHPDVVGPADWTRQTCASWVAAIDRMTVGEHVERVPAGRAGEPVKPKTKAGYLRMTRTFFRDLQEWEWIPRRFDPRTALATPRSIKALTGPDPRVIADDVWAKLLWAGLNLETGDLALSAGRGYPLELVRAITLVWLFSGQRSDEIARLRVGCIRWQHDGHGIRADDDTVLVRDAVCLLDVPTHKTGGAFTKPVDPLLGQALEAWQQVRPGQPTMLDRKTGENVHFLFAFRAQRVDKHYINNSIIPTLCRKAGVPAADVRGAITSHRARSTIASQLYDAKEPMTLFELQAWLGHSSPESTRHYAKITPNTLTRAYRDAGYFERNVRTIEVLIDRDAIASGQAAVGEPWQHYDLGHGLCGYTFFEQCPHRMACAKCDFYTPKNSSNAQLLEAKTNLQKMLTAIPLTDDEREAVDDGQAALSRLLDRLADVPTPAGPTPRQLEVPPSATLLPIVDIRSQLR
ncbi:integrase [Catenulispora sp. GP43]|uniref:tyrosine-type recombinase/integrase n=1 Tax=Catenulispora sp. GP43 TaxID=3156263 RepID=UPI003518FCC1